MKKIAAVLVLCLLLTHGVVSAQSASVTLVQNEAQLNFPNDITFSLDLNSTITIAKVKLHYGTTQDTCGPVSAIAFADITPGQNITASWKWDMRQSGGEPPGATIWWQWEVFDSQGNSQLSERKEIIWIDSVHPWQELDDGLIRLHYYDPDPNYGETLKNAAVAALNRLSQDIGIAPDKPIDLYIYDLNQDMLDAVFYEPGWTGGLAYPEYNIVIIGIEPSNLEWGKQTEAHEMTHVLEGDYTFSCLGATPTWLSEGLAVYGEGGPRTDWVTLFEKNKNDDTLLSFKVLSGGFSEDASVADLSYSQSYYMVNYLISNYGKEKMLGFLGTLKSGGELNDALLSSYGFDLNGFENGWRGSLGLSPVSAVVEQSTPVPTIIPTIIPIQGSHSQAADISSTPAASSTPMLASPDTTNTEITTDMPLTAILQLAFNKLIEWLPWILLDVAVAIIVLTVLLILFLQKGKRK
jgi:hypothetical protein